MNIVENLGYMEKMKNKIKMVPIENAFLLPPPLLPEPRKNLVG